MSKRKSTRPLTDDESTRLRRVLADAERRKLAGVAARGLAGASPATIRYIAALCELIVATRGTRAYGMVFDLVATMPDVITEGRAAWLAARKATRQVRP